MNSMIFLPVGYPVSFIKNGGSIEYIVENMSGTYNLKSDEFMLWTDLLRKNSESDLNARALQSLKDKKAVLSARDGETLFSLLFTCTPVRQGFGSVADNKYCIVLGEKQFFPSKLQMDFWTNADGRKPCWIFYALSPRLIK